MKKIIYICLLFLCLVTLGGCSKRDRSMPSDLVEYKRGMISTEDADEYYPTIEANGKKYIMYGSLISQNNSYDYAFGKCLGFVDNDTNDKVYELKGEDSDKWIINYYENGEMSEPYVLKEVTYTDNIIIPSSVKIDVPVDIESE